MIIQELSRLLFIRFHSCQESDEVHERIGHKEHELLNEFDHSMNEFGGDMKVIVVPNEISEVGLFHGVGQLNRFIL